jgi:hypothetical protein
MGAGAARRGHVIWINGPFGIGKTTLAGHLQRRLAGAVLLDPEEIGGVLRTSLGDIADYRVWPEWRALVVAFVDQLSRSHPYVISPMSVSNRTHWDEIASGVAELGCPLSALTLVADERAIIRRIREAPVEEATKTFRIHYLEADLAAFASSSFGTTLDTSGKTPAEVCEDALDLLTG